MIMDKFWEEKINAIKKAIENKNLSFIYNEGIRDLAFYYRTYYDNDIVKDIIDNLFTLLVETNNSLLQLSLIYLVSEISFIQILEYEEYYKSKIPLIISEIISKANKVKTTIDKDYPNEYKLYSVLPKAISLYLAGNVKTMESTLTELQKTFPDNTRLNILLALAKTKTSTTIYKVNLIEVIKIAPNNIDKAIAQELVGDISDPLQSISWYEDSENIYSQFGLYRDLVRTYFKKIEKLKNDPSKKLNLAQESIKLSLTLLKLNEKEMAKKYLLEGFNILLQMSSYIEILEIIKNNNLLESFPESKEDFQNIVVKTFEKRIDLDPYNINIYLEYVDWLDKFNLKSQKESILKTAYKISIERRLKDKLMLISKIILEENPDNIENIIIYTDSLIMLDTPKEEITQFLINNIIKLQEKSKTEEYNILLKKFSSFIPSDTLKSIEKEKLLKKINSTNKKTEKINILREYINNYPEDFQIKHLYIVHMFNDNKGNLKEIAKDLYNFIYESKEWYKENINSLPESELELVVDILLENQDFKTLEEIL